MLTFLFTDVMGRMSESEELTSGMVGKEVQILVDESWADLNKTFVFRSGDVCRTADGTESITVIPEDVLRQPFRRLYVGVYCTDEAGTLVIPTVMAEGPLIRYGADPTEDTAAEDLPMWKKLQSQIGDLQELITNDKSSLVAAINELARKTLLSEGTGLSSTAAELLIGILRAAVYTEDQSANINTLSLALNTSTPGEVAPSLPSDPEDSGTSGDAEVTMTHISVIYTRGDVTAGTSVQDLTGITVAAHYSDGTSEMVTDYTLSGTIAEGENIITVSYSGMTATFTVTGIAESGDEEEERVVDQTETLELVYASSYPNTTTFAYTEADSAIQYVVAKQSTLAGGELSVSFDETLAKYWDLNLYAFDADGNPYQATAKWGEEYAGSPASWGIHTVKWHSIGDSLMTGFSNVAAPFTVQIPDGCTFIACMRKGSAFTGDESLNTNSAFAQWAKQGGITFTVTTYK